MLYSKISVGNHAPAFTLLDDAGQRVSLSAFRGRRVVLYFYPKDSTTGCTIEACEFRDLLPRFESEHAVVLGISPDPVKSHAKFKAKFALTFPLLADTEHAVAESYGVWAEKSMYGNRYWANMRTTYVISADGVVEQVWEKVAHEGHAAAVHAFLRGEALPAPPAEKVAKKAKKRPAPASKKK